MRFAPLQFFTGLFRRRNETEYAIARAASLVLRTANIPSFRRSLPELAAELARARRYQRPLAVVMLGLENDRLPEHILDLGQDGNGNAAEKQILTRTKQIVSFVLASILRDALRDSDIATYFAADDRYVLVLTESNRARAMDTVQRLNDLFYQRVRAYLRAGIAEFPTDGLTLEDLVSNAQRSWHERPPAQVSLPVPEGRTN
jgi:GGDEF domain-containing protein